MGVVMKVGINFTVACLIGLLIGTLSLSLSGCAKFDNSKDYQKTTSEAPLRVPKELHPEAFSDQYYIP